jgi:hypothetical protein
MRTKFVFAMLSVAGSAVASQADATAITETYNYQVNFSDNSRTVNVAGADLYSFAFSNSAFGPVLKGTAFLESGATPGGYLNGQRYATAGLPQASEVFGNNTVVVGEFSNDGMGHYTPKQDGITGVDSYYHLKFTTGGQDYLGTAFIDSNTELRTITYDTLQNVSGGVPEPAVWADLLVGFGLAGTAMRSLRRRRQGAVTA